MIHIKALGLEVRNLLGSGSFAQVYQCYDYRNKKEYAVKMIKKETMSNSRVRAFFKEAEILETMDHKNIVKFHSFHQTDQYLLIKMELIRGGTLKKLIDKRKSNRHPFKEEEVAVVMKNLLEGIRYLHNLNVIHRDLKIENILLADDNDLSSIKIVDFGLSAKLEINSYKNIKAQCGTLLYMAPEMFNKPSYTKSVDIWSCSVIMYMLFNLGNHPFYVPGMKTEDFKHKLKTQEFPPLPFALAQNFIQKISKKQYEERYNVTDALKHPWITRNKDDEIPLSIHESFKGFDSTNEVNTVFFPLFQMLKLYLALGSVVPHKRVQIDEFYRCKVNEFASNNEVVRVYSPSRKKVRDKNNQLFIKMKKMFTAEHHNHNQARQSPPHSQEGSPTIKKHESFFTKVFQKQKSELLRNSEHIELRMIESSPHKESRNPFSLTSRKLNTPISFQSDKFDKFDEDTPLTKTTYIDRESMIKVQKQIEESVNFYRLKNLHEHRKKIFTKKPSFEDKEILGEKKIKIMKKLSNNYELEKLQEVAKKNNQVSSLTSKQLYNRKPMSPLKTQYSKHMTFGLNGKGYNQNNTSKKG